jgi:hypothetical protein
MWSEDDVYSCVTGYDLRMLDLSHVIMFHNSDPIPLGSQDFWIYSPQPRPPISTFASIENSTSSLAFPLNISTKGTAHFT